MRIMLLSVLLVGCASDPNPIILNPGDVGIANSPVSNTRLLSEKSQVSIDPYLLLPCPALTNLTTTNPSATEVLLQKKSDVLAYKECSLKQSSLVDLIKTSFNLQ